MICFFNTTKAWGGGEKWHFDVATRMHAAGMPVVVVTHKRSELKKRLEDFGMHPFTVLISNLSFLNPFKLLRLRTFFRTKQINTIVMNLPSDLKAAGIAAKMAGVERIIYRRGSAIPVRDSWLNRRLFKHVITEVLVNSRETKRTILANNPGLIDKNRIRVIYNGIRLQELKVSEQEIQQKQKTGEKDKINDQLPDTRVPVIGNLGRLEKQKAQYLLIDLAVRLRKENVPFQIRIGGDGSLHDELSRLIRKHRLEDQFRLTGYVHDVGAFMQEIDLFVLTSVWEGFGYVLAEAMACEKPIVAFDISSNPELVEHEKTGLLAKAGDVDDLAEKVKQLLSNPERCRKYGKRGREKVLRDFDFDKNYQKIRAFLVSRK